MKRIGLWIGLAGLLAIPMGVFAGELPESASTQHQSVRPARAFEWSSLSAAQQQALAPLAPEWDGLSTSRKRKWLDVARHFPQMSLIEQQRVQQRMREWVGLTPEQRRQVRLNYLRSRKLSADQKCADWLQYQQLTEAQKKHLSKNYHKPNAVVNTVPFIPGTLNSIKTSENKSHASENPAITSPCAPLTASAVAPTVPPAIPPFPPAL